MKLRERWEKTSHDRHNEYCRQKGYDAAIIPNKPTSERLRWMLQWIVQDARQSLALKIAPWLYTDEEYNR